MENSSAYSDGREQLGLRFTIDYLLYNKGHKTGQEESKESESKTAVPQTTLDDQITGAQNGRVAVQEKEVDRADEQEEQTANEKTELPTKTESQEQKPTESYIALISMAILASKERKLLLSDIYQWIMDQYPYFKSKDKNWRNSVRHNLSLNECFIKAGRSDNGKGHFWAIHPANFHDFSNGDYHRRQARRRNRRVTARLPFTLPTSYQPFSRMKGTPCWCCPHPRPLPCFTTREYWSWTALQSRRTLSLHGLV
ncbi:hypothetical protein MHYP_G00222850 [Metynnis hypsauchen]